MEGMKYDHAKMVDHVAQQSGLVAHLNGLKDNALNVLAQTQDFWTDKGATAYAEAQRSIVQAYEQVFQTIERHGQATGGASNNTSVGDAAQAARFVGI
ncbi:Uncharacterised protein [Mycolicibacterium vanbaalenii]|jgi:uncharacterized protein YukE|uniref:WXG100 family type VII secretion target n=1 Tax=Mycolicibacterium vanbaalenii TaxID=110539 RepID=A0A5S9QWW1_MYCVN|nr:hypothetical protein [Mycolicibacterium vanbaalenii]CAA0123285.1 Uncharacterised protein [Mycolicibacterium vanbaalenii]